MAEQLNNLWCISGLPGSGKTTLAQNLAETGDFESIERDQYIERFERLVGRTKLREVFSILAVQNPQEGYRNLVEYITTVKRELASYTNWLESLSTSAGPFCPPDAIAFYRELLALDVKDFASVLINDDSMVEDFVHFFSMYHSLTDATSMARGTDKTILFDSAQFASSIHRETTRIHLLANNITPQLLILRNTQARIFEALKDPRRQMSFVTNRNDPSKALYHHPYDPKENWEHVLVVRGDLDPQAVQQRVRERLLRGSSQDIFTPVKMVID